MRRRSIARRSRTEDAATSALVFEDGAAFHHEGDALELGDIAQRIAASRDQIGELPGFDRADAIAPAHDLGSGPGCRDDRRRRRLPEPHAIPELTRVLAV